MGKKKRYTVTSGCPQCGCTRTTVMTPEEMKARYGDVPNIDLECSQCLAKFSTPAKDACPEWDADCRMQEAPDGVKTP
jgi:hypothetical protein